MRNRPLVFLFLITLLSLPVWSQEAQVSFPERRWSLGSDTESTFLSVMGIDPMADGSLLVSDKLANTLLRLNDQGRITRTRQQKGSEPGAFNGPGPVAVCKDLIAVADFASDRIQLLTWDFEPIREITSSGSVFSLAFDDDGHLWIGALRGPKGETLFKYDREGVELLRRTPQAVARSVFDGIFHLTCRGGKIHLVYGTRNIIERWSPDGTPLGVITISGFPTTVHSGSKGIEESQDSGLPPDILFVGCAQDQAGRLALLAGDVGLHPRRDVFFVNEAGEIVALFTLPERSSAIRFDTRGRVLAVENRKRTVSCYVLQKER